MHEGGGSEGTEWDWVGKARGRIGMAVGRVPAAHSEAKTRSRSVPGIPSAWLDGRRTKGRWACCGCLAFKERGPRAAHLFQCRATSLTGIKTHCRRGRNRAVHVWKEASFTSGNGPGVGWWSLPFLDGFHVEMRYFVFTWCSLSLHRVQTGSNPSATKLGCCTNQPTPADFKALKKYILSIQITNMAFHSATPMHYCFKSS